MRATQPLLSPWWPALKFYWFNGAKQLQVMDLCFEREKIALFIGEIEQHKSAWMRKGEGEQGQPPPPWFHLSLVSWHRRGRNWNRVRYDSTTLFPLPPTAKNPLCPSLGVLSRFQHKWRAGVNKESHTCTEKAQKCTPLKHTFLLVFWSCFWSKISRNFTWEEKLHSRWNQSCV